MATETEIKLHLNKASQIEEIMRDELIVDHMREPARIIKMQTKYYDTPDWDLYKAGYMLRIRSENDNMVIVSLKRGSIDRQHNNGLCLRKKWICESPEINGAIEHLIACGAPDTLADLVGEKPLVSVCHADFTRTSALLYMDEGVVLEIAMDCGTLSADNNSQPLLEMELEVLFGNLNTVLPFCDALSEKYELQPETLTKFEKAYLLATSA